jgi:hypothetical protein
LGAVGSRDEQRADSVSVHGPRELDAQRHGEAPLPLPRSGPYKTPTGSEQSPCPDPPVDSIEMCIRSRDAA